MKLVRPTRIRVAHAIAVAAALLALALALREMPVFFIGLAVLAPLALASPFTEWTSVPARLARSLPQVFGMALIVLAVLAWFSRALSALLIDPTSLSALGALVFVPMAVAFALAPHLFAPGRTLVPAVIALLGLAALDPAPAHHGGSALPFLQRGDHNAFAELFLVLALIAAGGLWAAAFYESGPRWRRRDALKLVLVGVLAGAWAASGVVGLPLLQPRVERVVASALAQGQTGLSEESRLGEFAELAVSRRRVLDLQMSRPEPGPLLLRFSIFTAFDGHRWANRPSPSSAGRKAQPSRVLHPTAAPADVDPLLADIGAWFDSSAEEARQENAGRANETSALDIRIHQHEVESWPLLLPRGVVAVTADTPTLGVDRFGDLRGPAGLPLRLYGARLAGDEAPPVPSLTDDEPQQSLLLPPVVDERLRTLARRLGSETTPRERLAATIAHLRDGYRYTLRPGQFRTADPIAEFLFEKRAGYCEYFATAAVLLLRLEGVPARFVKGLRLGPQTDQGGGLHVVRESDAHAWVEAWIPGQGWVEADPTPPGASVEGREGASAFARFVEHVRAALSVAWTRLTLRGPGSLARQVARELAHLAARAARQPALWFLAVALVIGPRLIRLGRARRRRRLAASKAAAAVPSDLRALVREIERRWAAQGRPRPPARGLLEHSHALASAGSTAAPETTGVERRVLDAYYRARFGANPPTLEEVARLRAESRARPTQV